MRTSAIAVALLFTACIEPSSTSTLKGRTTDDTGSQAQGLTSDQLGGSGSVSATSKVRVSSIKADGTLTLITEAAVKSGGAYELSIPGDEKKLIVQSTDSSGKVRASVIVEQALAAKTTVVSPMSTESSVEAEVLLQMVAGGVTVAEANAVDLRARINSKTAEAVKSSSDATASIKALAEACAAAQRAQLKAYADVGVTTTQSALFDAQLAAAAKLNVALDAAADLIAAEKAYEDFIVELQAKAKDSAGDAKKASKGERAASIAFRATVNARLKASAAPVADAAIRHAASLEARSTTAACDAALTAGSAASTTLDAYRSAVATLHASLQASTSATATATAYASYQASVVGSASVSGSVLGSYLEVNTTTQASVQAAATATASAAAQLDAALATAATASLSASQSIDFDVYAAAVVSAVKMFDAAVQAQSAALATFGSKADVAIELMAQANGSLRVMD